MLDFCIYNYPVFSVLVILFIIVMKHDIFLHCVFESLMTLSFSVYKISWDNVLLRILEIVHEFVSSFNLRSVGMFSILPAVVSSWTMVDTANTPFL